MEPVVIPCSCQQRPDAKESAERLARAYQSGRNALQSILDITSSSSSVAARKVIGLSASDIAFGKDEFVLMSSAVVWDCWEAIGQ
jgi:hypothetical protein